jgi:putative transposase
MARPLRIKYSGAVYHLTSRRNERKAVFRDEEDRKAFLGILQRVNKRYNWVCHAYCLMGNLLDQTPDANVSLGMRQLNGVYTQAFNRRHQRSGHLFQGRYKAILIQKDSHPVEVSRYIVLNPVRAGAVERPGDRPWSSYRAMAGTGKVHPCLSAEWILGQFSADRGKAQKEYRRFVLEGIGKGSIWAELKGQVFLGGVAFVEGFIDHLKIHREIPEIPKNQRFVNQPELGKIFTEEVLRDRAWRDRKVEEAVEHHGYTQRQVADFLGLHFTSVSRIMNERTKMQRK